MKSLKISSFSAPSCLSLSNIVGANKFYLFLTFIAICSSITITYAINDDNTGGIDIQDLVLDTDDNIDDLPSIPSSDPNNKPDELSSSKNNPKEANYVSPKLKPENLYLYENFDDEQQFKLNWIHSKDSKYQGKWQLSSGPDRPHADKQLLLPNKARHYAISAKLTKPFKFSQDKPLIVQYEAQFREGLDCGGAYVKLLRHSAINDLTKLTDKTPFTIMFGPDKCGSESKIHFIVQYLNPKTQEYEEKHWQKAKFVTNLMSAITDQKYHLFKLVLEANSNFEIFLDDRSVGKGNLLEDMDPPINPPKEIVDANDVKPLDWDDRAQIDDADAKKPDDWDEDAPRQIKDPKAVKPKGWLDDEPKYVHDPEAKKPDDWEDMDGEWEAPLVENPACKEAPGCGEWEPPMIANPDFRGKWIRPKIDNPNYKGKWSPRMISNPDYFFDENPFKSLDAIGAISYELWSMADNVAFDNLIITDDVESASLLQFLTWQDKKAEADATSTSWMVRSMHYLKTYPWLWAVLVISIALPLFLFIAYCCDTKKRGSTTEPVAGTSSSDSARRKKTDEARPDRKEDIAEDQEASGDEGEDDDDDEEEEEEEEQEEEDEDEDDDKKALVGGDKVGKGQIRQRKKN